MSDTVDVKFLYPPNWQGELPDRGGWRSVRILLTCISDGTGEAAVRKLNISELRTVNGNAPGKTAIEKIEWDMSGFDNILLEWDRVPKETITVLSGQGRADYRNSGGLVDPGEGATGDILLTTTDPTAGGSYSIDVTVRLKDG